MTIRCRKGQTIKLTARNQASLGATYSFNIYADDNTVIKSYALGTGISTSTTDVMLTDITLNVPTGVYRYRWIREKTSTKIDTFLEGSIIVM